MEIQGNRQRLLEGGFTEQQVSAILDVLEGSTTQLVTRDYLDRRFLEMSERFDAVLDRRFLEMSEHFDAVLNGNLRQQKRDLLAWQLVMLVVFVGPLYVILLLKGA